MTHFPQMHNMDANSALGSISSLVDIVHVNCLPQNIAKIYSQGFFVFKQGVMHEYCDFNRWWLFSQTLSEGVYNGWEHTPKTKAENMYRMAMRHLHQKGTKNQLYRIFYYDCAPFDKGVHNPLSGKFVDFPKEQAAIERHHFFDELKKRRKLALRLGHLKSSKQWIISPEKTKDLLNQRIKLKDLKEEDIHLDMRPKGVDMKIGLDIASLSIKKMVSQIILISGDSDFVPVVTIKRAIPVLENT